MLWPSPTQPSSPSPQCLHVTIGDLDIVRVCCRRHESEEKCYEIRRTSLTRSLRDRLLLLLLLLMLLCCRCVDCVLSAPIATVGPYISAVLTETSVDVVLVK